MKKVFLIAIALISLQANAQRPSMENKAEMMESRMSHINDLSVDEIAEIQTKRMTFYLDLSPSQKNEVYKINLDIAKTRKEFMETYKNKKTKGKPSSDELYKIMNSRLDKQIEVKNALKKILTEEQLTKWSEMQMKNSSKGKPNFNGKM